MDGLIAGVINFYGAVSKTLFKNNDNIFLIFTNHFNLLILKIIFKK